MKKVLALLVLCVVSVAVVFAAQDTTLTQREVRDPKKLESYLEANATDAQTRIAALEISEGSFAVVDSTQLVFIASGVTNVIDSDITTP